MVKIQPDFYLENDVVALAKSLLGKKLVTHFYHFTTAVRITETEAYCGATDRACHAFQNKRTPRTQTMFGPGGHAYVYLCYGVHHLFNIVTNTKNKADAVLIRAAQPLVGIQTMQQRRGKATPLPRLATGPGNLSKALGITTAKNGCALWGDEVWLEDAPDLKANEITATTRIGVAYAGPDALLPWRFFETKSEHVSKR